MAFPRGYFIEPTAGMLYLAPFIAGIVGAGLAFRGIPGRRQARLLLGVTLASSTGALLFVASTGFTSQRFEVDFLPGFVISALAVFGVAIARSRGVARAALTCGLALMIAFGAIANMALGILGPYAEIVKNRPRSFVRIAGWFSPVEKFRPMLNPPIRAAFKAEFASPPERIREPLVTVGNTASPYFLYAENSPAGVRLVSRAVDSLAYDLATRSAGIQLEFVPESGTMIVRVNGREALAHKVGPLVTAPSEVVVGENRIDPDITVPRFTGRISR